MTALACGSSVEKRPEPPLIEVKGLTKRFGDRTVLDGLDLRIERGETIVMIGGSGSGKSTFARLLVGLDEPTAGKILIEGVDLSLLRENQRAAVRRRFAMVFQRHALLDSISVFDNVAFPLREETDMPEPEIRDRVIAALTELGVEAAAEKLPGELSGGMAKRVAIARATVIEPEILVYDEPTSGLDPITARTVDALIEATREQHLVTSLVITHDMATAYDVADRIVLLANGKVAANGSPDALFASHRSEILPFAISSGIDLQRLGPRKSRKTPSEIRQAWLAAHEKAPPARGGWLRRWREAHEADGVMATLPPAQVDDPSASTGASSRARST
jgi:phospholipid/cholesterol/gamma-HCH transport system ATP-binding protein